jgi:hypothetical protein
MDVTPNHLAHSDGGADPGRPWPAEADPGPPRRRLATMLRWRGGDCSSLMLRVGDIAAPATMSRWESFKLRENPHYPIQRGLVPWHPCLISFPLMPGFTGFTKPNNLPANLSHDNTPPAKETTLRCPSQNTQRGKVSIRFNVITCPRMIHLHELTRGTSPS